MSAYEEWGLEDQLAQLRQLYDQGLLSEDLYRAALDGLGVDPFTVFDQRRQTVDHQVNVAGNYLDRRRIAAEPTTSPEALRRAYLNRVFQQTRALRLSGIDPGAVAGDDAADLQLSAVYTALLTQQLAQRTIRVSGAVEAEWKEDARNLSAVELLNRAPHLVLLGDPGSGKSTFVDFVALCLAGEGLESGDANLALLTAPLPKEERRREEEPAPQPWDHGPLLPVRVVLRDLAARGLPERGAAVSADTLWAFITNELGSALSDYAPYLKAELLESGGLILLDGLDEVPDARQRRDQVKQVVQDFAACFPLCRFLVTSRTYAYQRQELKLDGFSEVALSPFTPAQVTRFVDGWYAHVGAMRGLIAEDAQGRATLLTTAIERNERLAELAARPLLLTLMASLHAWRGGSLPEKREALYADAVDLLLDQWESPKVVRDAAGQPLVRQTSLAEWLKVDRTVVRGELNRLAFEAHRDQAQLVGTADIDQERLVGGLMAVQPDPDAKPRRLIEFLRDRSGLLAARGEGVYAFPHRTFQEYLAACYLTDHDFPDELARLLRGDPERWREAVLLAGAKAARGTASAAWLLAEELCHHDLPEDCTGAAEAACWGALLAAQTLLENERPRLDQVSERNAPKLACIHNWVRAIVDRGWLPPVDRALAGEALSVLGDDRDLEELVLVPAGPFQMGDDGDDRAKPQHELALPAFRIGKYPVTNGQYRRFVEETAREWGSREAEVPDRSNCPAAYVSWHDARAYCEWLTKVWCAEGRIEADEEARLPTEAEWEKAARGDGDGHPWPWGDETEEDRGNTHETGLGSTCAVGMFPQGKSPFGCLDMAGQVREWTLSLWGENVTRPAFAYPYDPTDGREDVSAGNRVLRVVRGGSFDDNRRYARCSIRYRNFPYFVWDDYGFRVAVSPIS